MQRLLAIIQALSGVYCAVFATLAYFFPRQQTSAPSGVQPTLGAPMNLSGWLIVGLVVLGLSVAIPALSKVFRRLGPKIKVINVDIPPINPALNYPLKCYAQMRNEAEQAIDVSVIDYILGRVTLKKFVTDVLQLKFRKWLPADEGVDRVAVYPGQQFQGWIGPDAIQYSEARLKELKGNIGTLVLRVDGEEKKIPL
jgi:hypothetical protein